MSGPLACVGDGRWYHGLVAGEGVDEGSADSTAEQQAPAGGDVLGEPPHGAPETEESVAEPVDAESGQSRGARDEAGTGQQLAEGEG